MIRDDVKNMAQKIIESPSTVEITTKSSIGFGGAFAAMSINDIAGLVVAILTAIYMIFQIESAWTKRKKRRREEQLKRDER